MGVIRWSLRWKVGAAMLEVDVVTIGHDRRHSETKETSRGDAAGEEGFFREGALEDFVGCRSYGESTSREGAGGA